MVGNGPRQQLQSHLASSHLESWLSKSATVIMPSMLDTLPGAMALFSALFIEDKGDGKGKCKRKGKGKGKAVVPPELRRLIDEVQYLTQEEMDAAFHDMATASARRGPDDDTDIFDVPEHVRCLINELARMARADSPQMPQDDVIVVLRVSSSGSNLVESRRCTTTLSSLVSTDEKQSTESMTPSE